MENNVSDSFNTLQLHRRYLFLSCLRLRYVTLCSYLSPLFAHIREFCTGEALHIAHEVVLKYGKKFLTYTTNNSAQQSKWSLYFECCMPTLSHICTLYDIMYFYFYFCCLFFYILCTTSACHHTITNIVT